MDVLAARIHTNSEISIEGEVLVNNEPVDFQRFRHSIGYVTQDDYLLPTETVRECLMFSAQLRMPANVSAQERRKQVESTIEELVRTFAAF
jgi:ABC-type multidrug transport system ATPase subunit